MNKEKIKWIHAMKGIACLIVFFHHFFLTFYKATYTGNPADSKTVSGIDTTFAVQPYGIILNGHFAVCLFIILSAFLFAGKIMKARQQEKEIDFLNLCARRYFRLMLPVAYVGILIFLVKHILALINPALPPYPFELTLPELLSEVLIFQWITLGGKISGVLWTMEILFWGALLAAGLALFSTKKRWYMPFLYLLISYPMEHFFHYNFNIILGVILADLFYYDRIGQYVDFFRSKKLDLSFVKGRKFRNICGSLIVLMGLLIASYPYAAIPTNPVHIFFMKAFGVFFPLSSMGATHGFGVFVLCAGLLIRTENKILSSKPFEKLGNLSMGIYLQHGTIMALLEILLFEKMFAHFENYHVAVAVIFLIAFTLVLLTAWLYHKFIEKNIDRLVNKIHL